ncbi:UNVERIFIED_CONTAM: hypothetical protein NCL1_54946 [Trichonephila clavipes]
MLSSTYLPNAPTPVWETSFARKFLQIPKEQLEVINKLPEWSPSKSSIQTSRVLLEKIQYQPISQSTSVENNSFNQTSSLVKKRKIFKVLRKEKTFVEKEVFFNTSSSLEFQRENKCTSTLKRSNSWPNIFKEQPLISKIRKRKFNRGLKNNLSIMSDGGGNGPVNLDELILEFKKNSKDFSLPVKSFASKCTSCNGQQVVESSKTETCDKLENILGDKGLNPFEPSIAESASFPGSSGYEKSTQPLPGDIPTSQSQKYEKIKSPTKAKENLITKDVQAELTDGSLNDSSTNSKKVHDSSSKQVHIKKRKSREEKLSKRDAKKFRNADIKFTVDQITNMIDLIKVFQSELFT